jgi:hypothetical protein
MTLLMEPAMEFLSLMPSWAGWSRVVAINRRLEPRWRHDSAPRAA